MQQQRRRMMDGRQDKIQRQGENKGSRRGRVRSPTRPAVLDTKRKAKKQKQALSTSQQPGPCSQRGNQRGAKEETEKRRKREAVLSHLVDDAEGWDGGR